MQNLIFFGSDQYAQITLSHLSQNSQLSITQLHYLTSIPPITPGTIGLCASFDYLIPKEIIAKFNGNLYNLHPSLLPQYRNVSPVQYAIALGDKVTGITLFRIAPGIDDGEIIAQVSEPILPDDTTATLTPRLFSLGAQLFIDSLKNNFVPLASSVYPLESHALIFTHRLKRESGFIEWPVLHKLLRNEPISPADTTNELLALRLSRSLHDPRSIIYDLSRALTPWPGIWSTVPTRKGDLRISLVPNLRPASPAGGSTIHDLPSILISGKPKPISLTDFTKYYL